MGADPKLVEATRQGDPVLAALYRELLAVRRELPRDAEAQVGFDEAERWLHVQRGPWSLVMSFADADVHGGVRLGPLSGALVR